MNKQVIYDNHANNIEYFDLNRPKIVVVKKDNRLDLKKLSDDEIIEKIDEIQVKREELSNMFNMTNSESTLLQISKITSFLVALKIELGKRGLKDHKKITNTNINLHNKVDSLFAQLCKKDEKIRALKAEITKKDKVLLTNKTKRHEMTLNSDTYKVKYLLTYLKNLVDDNEFKGIISDIDDLNENTPQ